MTDINKVKIQSIIESQIPEFLNTDSPLFKEFLEQYYSSLEHPTGTLDLAVNLNEYKSIDFFNKDTFYTDRIESCKLTTELQSFDTTINVNHTIGFPSKNGLLKINGEIITYLSKTDTTFEECVRGFSGIDEITDSKNLNLIFKTTNSISHSSDSIVENLNIKFFNEFFRKYRYQFAPGFEDKKFTKNLNIESLLIKLKDFYKSKGTKESYKILFKILYDSDVDFINPQEYMLRPSDNRYFITNNILVEKIFGDVNPLDLKGKTITQVTSNGVASGEIYNIEFRPVNGKEFYEISLDPQKNILEFVSTKRTTVLEKVNLNSNTIIVDNTFGFPESGSLVVKSKNFVLPFTIFYENKNINEFFDVSGVGVELYPGDDIIEPNFAYIDTEDERVEFRVINLISDVDFSDTFGLKVSDTINLSSFGSNLSSTKKFTEWIYNIPTKHRIKSITQTSSVFTWRIELFDSVRFIIGENIDVILNDRNILSSVKNIIDDNIIEVDSGENIIDAKEISKVISKASSTNYPEISNFSSNIKSTYVDENEEYMYVASSGLPDYLITASTRDIEVFTPTPVVDNDELLVTTTTTLKTNKIHRFYSGEKVHFTPNEDVGINTGTYYVASIGNSNSSRQISLAYSNSELFKKNYIEFPLGISGTITKSGYENSRLASQQLLKKIPLKNNNFKESTLSSKSTNNRPIGMLSNGVEIFSTTLFDENIYYGKLDNIQINNKGEGYDVINSPELIIEDTFGEGAEAYLNITGSLKEVKVVNPGYGYDKNIRITLAGGNGSGADIYPNVIKEKIVVGFIGNFEGIDHIENTIQFIKEHNFENGELIQYLPSGNPEIDFYDEISGEIKKIPADSFYYVGVISDTKIKLYNTQIEAVRKINEINLTASTSSGIHYFATAESKFILTNVSVKSSGEGYSNKKVIIPSIVQQNTEINGVNLFDNYIYAKDHNFNDKDLVIYVQSPGQEISGLSKGSKYYVKVIDKNRFKLAFAGTTTISDENFIKNRFIRFSSEGTEYHIFSYPPIEINVEAYPETPGSKYKLPVLEPVITGKIDSVFLKDTGFRYGVDNIINYHRRPDVKIKNITNEAIFRPNVTNGRIVGVQVLNSGRGYGKDIDLIIEGEGRYAEIYPVIENERIVSVTIINSGIGYDNNTRIRVKRRGSDINLLANVYQWKINQVEKNLSILDTNDGNILVPVAMEDSELQCVCFYPTKELRKQLNDSILGDNIEKLPPSESPIIGWSYDGHPIYGPYITINGKVRNIDSSYELRVQNDSNFRPSLPAGIFIQDYIFNPFNENGLDEYNGKYIKNSDFPDGTYAYFYTIDVDSNGISRPKYPYIIGEEFKNSPPEENYKPSFNQKTDLTQLGLIRNTAPYYLNSENSNYIAIDLIDKKYKQKFIINQISSSSVTDVDIYSGGQGYKVGDLLYFDTSNTGGDGGNGYVFSVKGKPTSEINVIETKYSEISFYRDGDLIVGVSTTPLTFKSNDYVTISNISDLNYNILEGTKKITIRTKTVGITSDIPTTSQVGITTLIYPNDIVGYNVEDFIKIDDEVAKIIQIFPNENKLLIQRLSNIGVHTAGLSNIELLPRRFIFNEPTFDLNIEENKVVYFNPSDVVSVGDTKKTYKVDNQLTITIPERSIYIPNHRYFTNQPLIYNSGYDGIPILVSDTLEGNYFQLNDDQLVYVKNIGNDFIGLTTGIGTSYPQLYFSDEDVDFGNTHYFKTVFEEIKGDVENYSTVITTEDAHELISGDKIQLDLIPKISDTIKFRYDSTIKKITTEIFNFTSSDINLNNSEIKLSYNHIKTGDKLVYYSNGNSNIVGLTNNEVYFAIKTRDNHIKLALYYSDAIEGKSITISSTGGVGEYSFAKINPSIHITNGNIVFFDLKDISLEKIFLKLYSDINFENEIQDYEYRLSDGRVFVDTNLLEKNKEIYYSFISSEKLITIDTEVKNYNRIIISSSNYKNEYEIFVIDENNFSFNLFGKPEDLEYTKNSLSELNYTTKSSNPSGPINSVQINYGGNGYKKFPKIKIISDKGKDAIIKAESNKIGKISSLDRVKDGFDYPSDSTLVPVLSIPAVVQVEGISRVNRIEILNVGNNYNTPPILKVIGNDEIELDAILDGKTISEVRIIKNTNNLFEPLNIIPVSNSNGYNIDAITVIGSDVTLELLNSDVDQYPLIPEEYGSANIAFPFKIGDQIFIERCRLVSEEFSNTEDIIIKDNFNSSDYQYKFFTVTGINTENYTVTYSMDGIKPNLNLGEYTPEFGYGYVVNKKDMAEFEMYISNDLSYASEENVLGYDKSGTNIFSAKVMKNGWDNDNNELRLIDVKGNLNIGDILEGQVSQLKGTITKVSMFNLRTKLGVARSKINDLGDNIGFLNDYYQRISDNDYYQKFSYAIKGEVPYNIWKDSVASIIHPSGFKEFSELVVYNKAQSTVGIPTEKALESLVNIFNIDNIQSIHTKNNFGMVTEDELFEDGTIERIVFDEGTVLGPYLSLKTNKVVSIDSISSEFNGTSSLEVIANKPVTFISSDLYRLGVSTEGLNIGDKIGFSTYHFYPDSTYVFNIGDGYIELSQSTPHRLYSNSGTPISVVENLSFSRRVLGSNVIGRTQFDLKYKGFPLFYREFNSEDSNLLTENTFNIPDHNFQTGQQLKYNSGGLSVVAVASTSVGSGAILRPIFNDDYSIFEIKIISGGSGYNYLSPPKIEILNTESPLIEAIFTVIVEPTTTSITSITVDNSGLGYYPLEPNSIGIITSTDVEVRKDIIMEVGGGIGSAIYENGYNVAISTSTITGQSANLGPDDIGKESIHWGSLSPFIPTKETSGIGIGARFSVIITYDNLGQPLSESIVLRDGGSGYSVGDTVSIAGTFLGGDSPLNDISFVVSKVSNTRIESENNKIYTNIPSNTTVGYGSGAIFDVTRDEFGDISNVEVVIGGDNYQLEDNVSIAGTYIGGTTPDDDLLLSPTVLGIDKLPNKLYVKRKNVNEFQVFGTLTGEPLILDSVGIGTHSFELLDQNVNTVITIDNIMQTPLHKKNLEFELDVPIKYNDTIIYFTQNTFKLKLNDILKINEEFLIVKNTRVDGDNSVFVERGILGSVKDVHNVGDIVYVLGGNYNIIKDKIYFTSAPYGPTGLPGLEVGSSFSGRAFFRRSDPFYTNDKNIILDDVSEEFVGSGTTEFIIKSNGESVVGLYTNTNSIFGSVSGVDINNNPFILINNIPQIGEVNYTIDTPGENKLKFLGDYPVSGKIITASVLDSGSGYLPLVDSSAIASVSTAGEITSVTISGSGSGYTEPPKVSVRSNEGTGAELQAILDPSGSIDSIIVISPGIGYSTAPLPEIIIDSPQNYYNLDLTYADGYSGNGEGAKGSVLISNDSTLKRFILESAGRGYRVGDVLTASDIPNNQQNDFRELKIVVDETFSDSITGWYPGQFLQFNDISNRFNGFRKRFNLSVNVLGEPKVVSLKKALDSQDIEIENNLFVFINDILQVPNESYTFVGSRIIFKEAPREGSKCNIMFFRGSDLDVEFIDPILTIKEGDSVRIDANKFNFLDIPQSERTVKNIVTIDILDTFTYNGLGINVDQSRIRPIHWTKQTKDTIINGVLYSKSRPNLTSKITPVAKVIKDIDIVDKKIYVDSAIPLFEDVDELRGIGEENRDIIIVDNYNNFNEPELKANVGYAGTITSIDIINSGSGYILNTNPKISISPKSIIRKDPLINWKSVVGIDTDATFSAIGYGNQFIAIGSSGNVYSSITGKYWEFNSIIDENYDFNDIVVNSNNYIAIGNSGSIHKSSGISELSWQTIELIDDTTKVLGSQILNPSDYNKNFTKGIFSKNKIVVVGEDGAIFVGEGINPDAMYRYVSINEKIDFNINSIASNENYFVISGNSGNIYYSINGIYWQKANNFSSENLNDIIWDGEKFIVVGDSGLIAISNTGESWEIKLSNNILGNIIKIHYNFGIYTIINDSAELYFSIDLVEWRIVDILNNVTITNVSSFGKINEELYILLGTNGTILYSTPILNRAYATATTSNGQLDTVTVTEEGFGFSELDDIAIIVENEYTNKEKVFSIKAKGDFGTITDVQVFSTGNVGFETTSPAIEFTLQSKNYQTQILPNMNYSPIEVGDFFIISDSNVICGHALTGITTSLGGMTNYPNSKVGTSTTFIDGIYKAENVTTNNVIGISTVRCFFAPIVEMNIEKINVDKGINTTGFYGNYSFGVIYDYQNRLVENPKNFIVNKDNGLIGINTGPILYRVRPVR